MHNNITLESTPRVLQDRNPPRASDCVDPSKSSSKKESNDPVSDKESSSSLSSIPLAIHPFFTVLLIKTRLDRGRIRADRGLIVWSTGSCDR